MSTGHGPALPEGLVMQMEKPPRKEVKCPYPDCGQLAMYEMPPLQVLNTPTFSGVILAHELPRVCPHCQRYFQAVLADLRGVTLDWVPVLMKKEEHNIVTPPSGIWTPPN